MLPLYRGHPVGEDVTYHLSIDGTDDVLLERCPRPLPVVAAGLDVQA